MKILLAEDDPTIRKLYGEVLESCGHAVITARDGREALTQIAEGECDLVVMDLHMPNMNGFEALEEMKRQGSNLPVIVISGFYPEDVMAEQFQDLGLEIKEVLKKPVKITDISDAIHRVTVGMS